MSIVNPYESCDTRHNLLYPCNTTSTIGFVFVNALTTLCPIVSFALISVFTKGLVFGNDTGLPQNSHSVAPAGSGAPQDLHLMIFVPILHIPALLRNVRDKQQYQ